MTEREARGYGGARPALLTVLIALMMLAASGTATAQPAADASEDGSWQPVTLLFMTDVKGKIEPCG